MGEMDTGSFWAEIKKYEDMLAAEPDSYCFVNLSEAYRRIGLLDDALTIAQRGVTLHPDYLAAHMALARAYADKKLADQALKHLEKVVAGMPEWAEAQHLVANLRIERDQVPQATSALKTILFFHPDDVVAHETLARLVPPQVTSTPAAPIAVDDFDDEELLEEAEILDAEIVEDDWEDDLAASAASESFSAIEEAAEEPAAVEALDDAGPQEKDPLTTATLAEIYISQGFLKRGLKIYRDLVEADPTNEDLRQRLVELKLRIDEDEAQARLDLVDEEAEAAEPAVPELPPAVMASAMVSPHGFEIPVSAEASSNGSALDVLQRWLGNIERRRQCH